jgi:hypothetical protein
LNGKLKESKSQTKDKLDEIELQEKKLSDGDKKYEELDIK